MYIKHLAGTKWWVLRGIRFGTCLWGSSLPNKEMQANATVYLECPGTNLETQIWVQVVCLGRDVRKPRDGSGEGRHSPQPFSEQVTTLGNWGSVLLEPLGDSRKQNSVIPLPPTGKKFGALFTIIWYSLLEGCFQRLISPALPHKTLRPRMKGAYRRRQTGDGVRVSIGQRVGTVGGVRIMKTLAMSDMSWWRNTVTLKLV